MSTWQAVSIVRPIPFGASRPVLVQTRSDLTVVAKYQSNPQGPRLLVNEWIGYGLSARMGLRHPAFGTVDLPSALFSSAGEMHLPETTDLPEAVVQPGLAFGTILLESAMPLTAFHASRLEPDVRAQIAGMIVVDLIIGNDDRSDANPNVLVVLDRVHGSQVHVLDFGHVAGSATWERGNLMDVRLPPQGQPLYKTRLSRILSSIPNPRAAMAPWLDRLATIGRGDIESLVGGVPDAWPLTRDEGRDLVGYLDGRRRALPEYFTTRLARRSWWQ